MRSAQSGYTLRDRPAPFRNFQGCFRVAQGYIASPLFRQGGAIPSPYQPRKNASTEFSALGGNHPARDKGAIAPRKFTRPKGGKPNHN